MRFLQFNFFIKENTILIEGFLNKHLLFLCPVGEMLVRGQDQNWTVHATVEAYLIHCNNSKTRRHLFAMKST